MKFQDHDFISSSLNLSYEFIGYARGLIVLWNRDEAKAEKQTHIKLYFNSILMKIVVGTPHFFLIITK